MMYYLWMKLHAQLLLQSSTMVKSKRKAPSLLSLSFITLHLHYHFPSCMPSSPICSLCYPPIYLPPPPSTPSYLSFSFLTTIQVKTIDSNTKEMCEHSLDFSQGKASKILAKFLQKTSIFFKKRG